MSRPIRPRNSVIEGTLAAAFRRHRAGSLGHQRASDVVPELSTYRKKTAGDLHDHPELCNVGHHASCLPRLCAVPGCGIQTGLVKAHQRYLAAFRGSGPAEIYATLLDDGACHCSIRMMYRLLGQHGEVRERRRQLRHPVYQKPELLAEKPKEVWSWGTTKLMGPAKWSYFCLCVILDIFSRRVVGWRVADAESATLFRPLFNDAIAKHDVTRGQLTLHADRRAPMKAKATAFLLADLGVTRSHRAAQSRWIARSMNSPSSSSRFRAGCSRVSRAGYDQIVDGVGENPSGMSAKSDWFISPKRSRRVRSRGAGKAMRSCSHPAAEYKLEPWPCAVALA